MGPVCRKYKVWGYRHWFDKPVYLGEVEIGIMSPLIFDPTLYERIEYSSTEPHPEAIEEMFQS